MLRLIIQTVPNITDDEPNPIPAFTTYDVDNEAMEKLMSSLVPANHRRTIIGCEVIEKPKVATKPEPGSLAEKLAKYKADKLAKEGGTPANGSDKGASFSKWEKKAEEARRKEANNKKKQEEVRKASRDAKRTWWGGRKAKANGATT